MVASPFEDTEEREEEEEEVGWGGEREGGGLPLGFSGEGDTEVDSGTLYFFST